MTVQDSSLVGLSTENLGFSKGESKELTKKAYQSIPVSQDGLEAISRLILISEPEFPSASPENCLQKPVQVC